MLYEKKIGHLSQGKNNDTLLNMLKNYLVSLSVQRLKNLSLLTFLLCSFNLFGQTVSVPSFNYGPYKYIFYGPNIQYVFIDRDLNIATAPVPFDRFFYLKKYEPIGSAPVSYLFQEYDPK